MNKQVNHIAKFIHLPKIEDERGNLTYIEEENQIPFRIQRVYWIYDVPGGESRGSHAFRATEELIIPLSGSFDVILHDGEKSQKYQLNRSYIGLYIPKMIYWSLDNFSTNSLALILASTNYSVNDYIRDFNVFLKLCEKS